MIDSCRKLLMVVGLIFSFFVPSIGLSQNISDTIFPPNDLTLPFASVAVGKQSTTETITISNSSINTSITISQIQLTGPDRSVFSLNLNGGSAPCRNSSPTISAGGFCTLTVHFVPNEIGPRTAFLNLSLGTEKIAFHNTATKGISIYDLSTKTTIDLTTPPTGMEDSGPSWSPNGGTIVFTRHAPGIDVDGTLMTVLLTPPSAPTVLVLRAGTPSWSPDGKKIAYRDNIFAGIRFFGLLGIRESSFGGTASGELKDPSWSPDGNAMIFGRVSLLTNRREIVKVSLSFDAATGVFASSDQEKILSQNGNAPAWSPDGQKIAFQNTSTIPGTIDMVDPNGSGGLMMTHPVGKNPSWSPDSSQLVFHRASGTSDEIVIINADGTGEQTPISTTGKTPAWSPDLPQVALSGTGLSVGTNSPPAVPQLVAPKHLQTGLGRSVTLSWLSSSDPEGSAVSYQYTVCEIPEVIGCTAVPAQLAKTEQENLMFAGVGLFVFGISFIVIGGKNKSILSLIVLIVIVQFLLGACGGGSGGGNTIGNSNGGGSQELTQFVPNLKADTTYFWQITASDALGARSKSTVRQFKT